MIQYRRNPDMTFEEEIRSLTREWERDQLSIRHLRWDNQMIYVSFVEEPVADPLQMDLFDAS